MPSSRFPIPQGTLDMLILQILSLEPAHGYGIAQRLEQISNVRRSGQPGLSLSGPSPAGTEGVAEGRVEAIGNRTRGQVLFLDALRTQSSSRVEKDSWARLAGAVQLIFDEGRVMMQQLLNWFRRDSLESDLDRELPYHIDRRVSDLMRSGLPEPEARRRAALELGGATQVREEVRDVWLTRWLRDFVYDLRFSARSFLRSPVVYRHGSAFARARHWSDDRHLLSGRSGRSARASGRPSRTPGSHRLERRSSSRDLRQSQPDVVPDLPRSPAAEAILRRRILPCRDNDQPLDGRRTEADGRGTRLGYILFGAGSEPRAGQAVDDR